MVSSSQVLKCICECVLGINMSDATIILKNYITP